MTTPKVRLSSVAVVSHVFATGPAHELVEYLRGRVNRISFIRHPFDYAVDIRSSRDVFLDGKLLTSTKTRSWRLPGVLVFAKDLAYTIFWLAREKCQFDLYVGADCLNCFAGLLLKRLGRVKTVTFYTIDFVHKRFENRVLNRLYLLLDIYCATNADFTWNLSPRMSTARGFLLQPERRRGREITVPMGVWLDRIKPLPLGQVDRRSLVFIGHLRKGHGVELILRSMPKIIAKVPQARLVIIGTGPLEHELKRLVTNLGLHDKVEFKGFLENPEDAERLLVKCAIGLAPYEPTSNNFTFYTDPGKPKLYLACGLPVIITRVPSIAELVATLQMGIVVRFDYEEVAEAAVRLLTDAGFYERCRNNALNYALQLDWDHIFDSALAGIM